MFFESNENRMKKKLLKKGWNKLHKWFAWFPVELESSGWVGFCFVNRIRSISWDMKLHWNNKYYLIEE